jgi:hypothetical protein
VAVANLALDEVNRDLAARCAAAVEVELGWLAPRDGPRMSDAVLYDTDFLPPDYRAGLLAETTTVKSRSLVAAYGYYRTATQRCRLRRGIIVTRRICLALFARLARRAGALGV